MEIRNVFSKTIIIATTFLVGCNLQKSNPLDLGTSANSDVPSLSSGQITFKVVYSQVLKNHCVSCHSEKGGNKGDVNLETYKSVLNETQSIREEILSQSMPPRKFLDLKLSQAQIKLIIDWIDSGAKENGEQGLVDQPPVVVDPGTSAPPVVVPPPPVTSNLVFAEIMEKVLKTNCTKCHSDAGGNRGDVNLETYDNVKAALLDIKFDIETDQMPPKPPRGTPLTDEQKNMLLGWIENGAKEN